MSKQKTTTEFIAESNLIHNDKYDYSKTIYVSGKKKVKIICKVHGEFEQIAGNHLKGHGCKWCISKLPRKVTLDYFIYESNKIHKKKIRLLKNKGNANK